MQMTYSTLFSTYETSSIHNSAEKEKYDTRLLLSVSVKLAKVNHTIFKLGFEFKLAIDL